MKHLQTKFLDALTGAAKEIAATNPGPDRERGLRALATMLVGKSNEVRLSVLAICPEVAQTPPIPDTEMCDEEHELTVRMGEADRELLDATLISHATHEWQPLHRVIGCSLADLTSKLPNIPLAFYAQRAVALESDRRLQLAGNSDFIRLTMVRLPGSAK